MVWRSEKPATMRHAERSPKQKGEPTRNWGTQGMERMPNLTLNTQKSTNKADAILISMGGPASKNRTLKGLERLLVSQSKAGSKGLRHTHQHVFFVPTDRVHDVILTALLRPLHSSFFTENHLSRGWLKVPHVHIHQWPKVLGYSKPPFTTTWRHYR